MIRFWCQCGRQLKANDRAVGEMVRCGLCHRLHVVPEGDLPRTADFPPLPPRGSINASGEITRRAFAPAQGCSPEAPDEDGDEARMGWLSGRVVVGLGLACAASVAACLLLRGLAAWVYQ
jgi:hypothetical protein